jgi:hypothetical protein
MTGSNHRVYHHEALRLVTLLVQPVLRFGNIMSSADAC